MNEVANMKTSTKVILALLVGSILLNGFIIVQMTQINQQLNNTVTSQLDWIESQVSSVEYSLSELEQRDQWVRDIQFSYGQQPTSPRKLLIDVSFTLSEAEKEASFSFLYRKNDGKWIEAKANQLSALSYETTIELDPAVEYSYQIIEEGTRSRGSEVGVIPYEVYKPTSISIGYGWSTNGSSEITGYELYVDQYETEDDLYQVDKIYVLITREGNQERKPLQLRRDKGNERSWFVEFSGEEHTTAQIEVHYQNGYVEVIEADLETF